MQGITTIELVPGVGDDGIVQKLQHALRTATTLKAAVAYWCVGTKELGPELVARLGGAGFLCVDIHLPTDIDRLAALVRSGANVFLHLLSPNPQPGELKSKVPLHLLHTKQLLFDLDSSRAELWIGSHNWTARALTGINIESSLRVALDPSCELYQQASLLLDDIRRRCVPFDLSAVDYYKWLQGADLDEPIWVLELGGARSSLGTHRRLTVFGVSEVDYRNLKKVDTPIVVSLLDESAGKELLYEASIRDTGRTTEAGLAFDSRLYAVQIDSRRPELCGPAVPAHSVRDTAIWWATIELADELLGASFEPPPLERWVPLKGTTIDEQRSAELRKWFSRPDKALVRAPLSRQVFEGAKESLTNETRLLSATDTTRFLLRKKVVRAIRRDGERFRLEKRRQTLADEDGSK